MADTAGKRRRLAQQRRQAAIADKLKDPKWRRWVLRDHGPICWICSELILLDAPPYSPRSFAIDHVKPRSTHPELALVLDNLRPSHARCNRIKSDGTVEEARIELARRKAADAAEVEMRAGGRLTPSSPGYYTNPDGHVFSIEGGVPQPQSREW